MMTITELSTKRPAKSEERLLFPLDLGEWTKREDLLAWITQTIGSLNWYNPKLIEYLKAHPQYRPKELLTVLTFAYATGTFESEEIGDRCHADPDYRGICGDFSPNARSIARFRRDNRGLLKWLLAELLKQVLKVKFNLGNTVLPAGLRRHLLETAVERLDLARHLDRAGCES